MQHKLNCEFILTDDQYRQLQKVVLQLKDQRGYDIDVEKEFCFIMKSSFDWYFGRQVEYWLNKTSLPF